MELGPQELALDSDREPLPEAAQPHYVLRRGMQFLLDIFGWLLSVPFATWLRYEFDGSRISWLPIVLFALAVALGQYVTGHLFALYRGRYNYGTFEEVRAVSWSAATNGIFFMLTTLVIGPLVEVPRSVIIIALPFALVWMFGTRYIKRLFLERKRKPSNDAAPTIIYGAGYLGEVLVRRMTTDPESKYRPVAFLDDSKTKSNLELRGVPVSGTFKDLEKVAQATGASTLVVAIGYADPTLLQNIVDSAQNIGLDVKVLPVLNHVLEGASQLTDLRTVNIEDLISRPQIDTDVESIAGYLTGKRVLVTGAGGSIGSELCVQISRFGPRELSMLDRDETALQAVQIETAGSGLLDTNSLLLADIRDAEALKKIFSEHNPEVVFHAAALKHLPLLEKYPDEAWKTNVLGTLNVLRAANAAGVETFVNISTDKAADPTSVLGHSKRLAEKLTAAIADETKKGARYVSVRFGNVIGSRGSMLPTFTRLIERGGPFTVTHPQVSRYFMTIPEACQLVLQAGGIGRSGEVLILDMGEPVSILDVAKRMIRLSGKKIDIIFTGLRDGEKLHESLIGENETASRPFHELISHARIGALNPQDLSHREWQATVDRAGKL